MKRNLYRTLVFWLVTTLAQAEIGPHDPANPQEMGGRAKAGEKKCETKLSDDEVKQLLDESRALVRRISPTGAEAAQLRRELPQTKDPRTEDLAFSIALRERFEGEKEKARAEFLQSGKIPDAFAQFAKGPLGLTDAYLKSLADRWRGQGAALKTVGDALGISPGEHGFSPTPQLSVAEKKEQEDFRRIREQAIDDYVQFNPGTARKRAAEIFDTANQPPPGHHGFEDRVLGEFFHRDDPKTRGAIERVFGADTRTKLYDPSFRDAIWLGEPGDPRAAVVIKNVSGGVRVMTSERYGAALQEIIAGDANNSLFSRIKATLEAAKQTKRPFAGTIDALAGEESLLTNQLNIILRDYGLPGDARNELRKKVVQTLQESSKGYDDAIARLDQLRNNLRAFRGSVLLLLPALGAARLLAPRAFPLLLRTPGKGLLAGTSPVALTAGLPLALNFGNGLAIALKESAESDGKLSLYCALRKQFFDRAGHTLAAAGEMAHLPIEVATLTTTAAQLLPQAAVGLGVSGYFIGDTLAGSHELAEQAAALRKRARELGDTPEARELLDEALDLDLQNAEGLALLKPLLKHTRQQIDLALQKSRVPPKGADLTSAERLKSSERVFEREGLGKVPPEAESIIQSAHEVGRGQAGRDGTPARVGNYTRAQLKQKAEILKKGNFTRAQRRALMEHELVGDSRPDDYIDDDSRYYDEDMYDVPARPADAAPRMAADARTLLQRRSFKLIAESLDSTKPAESRRRAISEVKTLGPEEIDRMSDELEKQTSQLRALVNALDKAPRTPANVMAGQEAARAYFDVQKTQGQLRNVRHDRLLRELHDKGVIEIHQEVTGREFNDAYKKSGIGERNMLEDANVVEYTMNVTQDELLGLYSAGKINRAQYQALKTVRSAAKPDGAGGQFLAPESNQHFRSSVGQNVSATPVQNDFSHFFHIEGGKGRRYFSGAIGPQGLPEEFLDPARVKEMHKKNELYGSGGALQVVDIRKTEDIQGLGPQRHAQPAVNRIVLRHVNGLWYERGSRIEPGLVADLHDTQQAIRDASAEMSQGGVEMKRWEKIYKSPDREFWQAAVAPPPPAERTAPRARFAHRIGELRRQVDTFNDHRKAVLPADLPKLDHDILVLTDELIELEEALRRY